MQAETHGVEGVGSVAILGLGVMGGSLARALSELPVRPVVVGWSPEGDEARSALGSGAIDRAAATPEEAAAAADLVVLAAPLGACVALVPRVLEAMASDAVLTDVASLKVPVRDAVAAAGGVGLWVGSHPMCGSEGSGFAASVPTLYRGARVWLVVPEGSEGAAPAVEALWGAVRAHVEWVDADAHDRLMALASHLPQLAANGLAAVLEDLGVGAAALGPGGRDTTRLAGSAPAMWRDLLAHADPALPDGLRRLSTRAHELADLVESRDLDALVAWMERTRRWRGGA